MKDIDFDELDRAVSSVLGGSVTPSTPNTDEAASSAAVAPTASVSAPESAPVTKKSFVQKRTSGRFMDVVHPSSDMKSQGTKASVPRQAPTIAPLASDQTDAPQAPEVSSQAAGVADSSTAVAQKEPAAPASPPSDAHVLPDPLDFHNFSDDSSTDALTKEASAASVDDKKEADEAEIALEQAASELSGLNGLIEDQREVPPLDTPFVNDLAVEKRPLGAFSVGDTDESLLSDEAKDHMTAVADSAESTQEDDEMQTAIKHELTKNEEDPKAPVDSMDSQDDAQVAADTEVVPEELHEDIVAIESREVTPEPATHLAAASASIPQQYAQKPTEQSHEVTPVFDATPLKHVDKKKSGWLHVVVIILLIILGAGGGAALYFFDPFNLF